MRAHRWYWWLRSVKNCKGQLKESEKTKQCKSPKEVSKESSNQSLSCSCPWRSKCTKCWVDDKLKWPVSFWWIDTLPYPICLRIFIQEYRLTYYKEKIFEDVAFYKLWYLVLISSFHILFSFSHNPTKLWTTIPSTLGSTQRNLHSQTPQLHSRPCWTPGCRLHTRSVAISGSSNALSSLKKTETFSICGNLFLTTYGRHVVFFLILFLNFAFHNRIYSQKYKLNNSKDSRR